MEWDEAKRLFYKGESAPFMEYIRRFISRGHVPILDEDGYINRENFAHKFHTYEMSCSDCGRQFCWECEDNDGVPPCNAPYKPIDEEGWI